ncbi:MAG TPA: hypothetical protein VNK70_02075 [Candidatus Paceibacterota bacterium]|nr:hypothetical protein [Candidatus Paceibacterota bacterium]
MEDKNNKISESEMIVIGGLMFLTDGICLLIDFTVVGPAFTPVIQSAATFTSAWWFSMKGDSSAFNFGKMGAQLGANILPWLPTLTVAFAINTFTFNHPRLTKTVGTVVGKIKPSAGTAVKILKKAA